MMKVHDDPSRVKSKTTSPSNISVDDLIDMVRNCPADLPPGYLDDLESYKDIFGNPLPGYSLPGHHKHFFLCHIKP